MRLHALADVHLSFSRPKPMDIFGPLWADHPARIAAQWDELVRPEDVVLLPGDISWAHTLDEAAADLEFLHQRSGRRKLLLKGNHDSWWSSSAKVRRSLPDSLGLIDADAIRLPEGVVVCGARGWTLPGTSWFEPDSDARVYRRELGRLERSLGAARRLAGEADIIVAMLHFPPLAPGARSSEVLDRLSAAGVSLAAYGHLHGEDHSWAPEGEYADVELRFVAADRTGFRPVVLFEEGRGIVAAAPAEGAR